MLAFFFFFCFYFAPSIKIIRKLTTKKRNYARQSNDEKTLGSITVAMSVYFFGVGTVA